MATQGTNPPNDDSALTRCPECREVFEIDADMLESPDTRVRCGDCLTVFDARVNRYVEGEAEVASVKDNQPEPQPEPKPGTGDGPQAQHVAATGYAKEESRSALLEESEGPAAVRLVAPSGSREFSELDVTYADFDLFSEEADLPEVVFDETPATGDFPQAPLPESRVPMRSVGSTDSDVLGASDSTFLSQQSPSVDVPFPTAE